MAIFISYSHSDRAFAERLAAELITRNANVWVDRWEIRVGESLLQRIQQAIMESSALLVILSKASVQSEWCKRELSAGIMRELEERCVIVLPILTQDCEIPIFLREKRYADFRESFEDGLSSLLPAIAKITNVNQGRIGEPAVNLDWAMDWAFEDGLFTLKYTIIETSREQPTALLTEIGLRCDEVMTRRYREYVAQGLDVIGRTVLADLFLQLADETELKIYIDDQFPKKETIPMYDKTLQATVIVSVTTRRLGEDTGNDTIVNIASYMRKIQEFTRSRLRKPTDDELKRLSEILKRRI